MAEDTKPAGFAYPESARQAGEPGDHATHPIIETATPGIAEAVADIDAERADPNSAERKRNARERALAGHVAPDTVDLPEAKLRAEDNEAAAKGLRPNAEARRNADKVAGREKASAQPTAEGRPAK